MNGCEAACGSAPVGIVWRKKAHASDVITGPGSRNQSSSVDSSSSVPESRVQDHRMERMRSPSGRSSRETCGNRWTMTICPPTGTKQIPRASIEEPDKIDGSLVRSAVDEQSSALTCPQPVLVQRMLRKRLHCAILVPQSIRLVVPLSHTPPRPSAELTVIIIFSLDNTPPGCWYKRYISATPHREERRRILRIILLCGFLASLCAGLFPCHRRPEHDSRFFRIRVQKERERESICDRQATRLAGLVDGHSLCKQDFDPLAALDTLLGKSNTYLAFGDDAARPRGKTMMLILLVKDGLCSVAIFLFWSYCLFSTKSALHIEDVDSPGKRGYCTTLTILDFFVIPPRKPSSFPSQCPLYVLPPTAPYTQLRCQDRFPVPIAVDGIKSRPVAACRVYLLYARPCL